MTDQHAYDAIAERHRESKWLLFRHYIERYTLFAVLGDLRDRTVLDLACGDGVYTRQFKRAGAAAVTGVDISPAMIALAEWRSARIRWAAGTSGRTRRPSRHPRGSIS